MRELITLHLLAQAYSCDAYGAGGYGECAEESTSSSSSTPQGTTAPSQSTNQTEETKTEDSTETTTPTTRPTQPSTLPQTSTGTTQSGEVGVPGYEFILLWSFLIAFVIALIILLWRRHKRSRQYQQFGGNDTFYPPGPPQPPVGQ